MTTNTRSKPSRDRNQAEPKYDSNLPVAQQVLANAQASREVVQEFCPLAESLEWELGQQYLRERGNKAFISDASPVPFVVNNDGTLSRNAAEVFFANLVESEKTAPLEDEIFVLELGIGVGLFARFFLDNFRDLCQKHGKDYYDRLCYIAADRSERMLTDVLRHGVLGNHAGHYRVRLIDAMEPDKYLPDDAMFSNRPGKPLRAVFLNYLLDCLPAAVLELDKEAVRQLYVRTCVARNVQLKGRTDMTLNMLQARAESKDPKAKQELLEVYGLFASEYDYRPVDASTLPYGNFALEFAQRMSKRMLHNFGALQCLEKLLGLVHDDGMILINDYGQTQPASRSSNRCGPSEKPRRPDRNTSSRSPGCPDRTPTPPRRPPRRSSPQKGARRKGGGWHADLFAQRCFSLWLQGAIRVRKSAAAPTRRDVRTLAQLSNERVLPFGAGGAIAW